MPSLREAHLRHAQHYEARLRSADNLYRQDAAAMQRGLALFDLERPNIQAGQAWAAAHGEIDPLAAELCSAYALEGSQCLSLRLHPRELFELATAARASARRTADRGA